MQWDEKSIIDSIISMGRDGLTLVEIASLLNTTRKRLEAYANQHPRVMEAIELAHEHCEAYFMRLKRDHLIEEDRGPKLNAKLWEWTMRHKFGYVNKDHTMVQLQEQQAQKLSTEELIALYNKGESDNETP